MSFIYEKTLWRWFNKRSMQWVQVAKFKNMEDDPWALVRGTKGRMGYRRTRHASLGDLIAALYDHELDSLLEKFDIPAMEFLAMAADKGEMT